MNTKKALVLSGGSIKGAFQAGAVKAVLETGFAPDIITGISVGSLNGTFIANEAGRMLQDGPDGRVDWPQVGQYLYDFWKQNITSPASIVTKRNIFALLFQLLFKKFRGVRSSKPIDTLIDKNASMEYLRASGIELAVGVANLVTGKIMYAEPRDDSFLDYLKGSKAIPIVMPHVTINNETFLDGGLRDSAPLRTAIKKGATEIICVLCHSKELAEEQVDPGNLIRLGSRLADIHSNETINNDIEFAEYCNAFLPGDGSPKQDEPFKGYRKLNIKTIRPDTEVQLNLETFTGEDILRVMNQGYDTAKKILQS
jgi:NTE family protein